MDFKGKKVFEEAPDKADNYRKDYLVGIEIFLEKLKKDGNKKREGFISPLELVKKPEHFRMEYYKMLGLDRLLTDDNKRFEKEYVGEDEIAKIYRIKVYVKDIIPFYAMLFIPHNVKCAPLVIAQHGGGGTPELCADINGKNNYNHMVQRILEKGAVVIAPQLLLWAMTEAATHREHKIPFNREKTDMALKHFGLSITGLEIAGIMAMIDYGVTLDEVDSSKIAMLGLSYGGYFTLHTMAADKRIKAGYSAACFNDRNVYDWGNWTYQDSGNKFHDAEVAGLCAPRKLYVEVGKNDAVFDYKTAIAEADKAKEYYKAYKKEENFIFSLWDGGHTFPDDDNGFDFLLKF